MFVNPLVRFLLCFASANESLTRPESGNKIFGNIFY